MAAEMMEGIRDGRAEGNGDGSEAADRIRIEDMEAQARSFIREYPLASLAAAVVLGYVAARLLPRI